MVADIMRTVSADSKSGPAIPADLDRLEDDLLDHAVGRFLHPVHHPVLGVRPEALGEALQRFQGRLARGDPLLGVSVVEVGLAEVVEDVHLLLERCQARLRGRRRPCLGSTIRSLPMRLHHRTPGWSVSRRRTRSPTSCFSRSWTSSQTRSLLCGTSSVYFSSLRKNG